MLLYKRGVLCCCLLLSMLITFTVQPQTRYAAIIMPADHANAAQFALYEKKALEAAQWLSLQPNLRFVPADSLANHVGEQLTPLFADVYDPFGLAAANRHLRLDALVFFSLLLQEGGEYLHAEAYEFPSGIFTERLQIRLSDSPEWKWDRIFARSFKNLLLIWEKTASPLHRPFPADVRGLVVLTDDLSDSLYLHHCRYFLDHLPVDEHDKPLRLKVLEKVSVLPSGSIYPEGFALIGRTAAEYLIYLHLRKDRLTVNLLTRADSLYKQPVCEWRLPMLPEIPQLTCLQLQADSSVLEVVGRVFFHPLEPTRGLSPAVARSEDRFHDDAQAAMALWACIRTHQGLPAGGSFGGHADFLPLQRGYETVATTTANKTIQAWSWLHLGSLLVDTDRAEQALLPLQRADSLFSQLRDPRGMAFARIELAAVLSAREAWQQAFTVYERAIDVPPDSISRACIMNKMALILERQDRIEEAIRLHHRVAHLYDRLQRPYEAATVYDQIGELLRNRGQFYRSVAYLDTFLLRAQAMGSEPAMARAHFQVGLSKFKLAKWDDALMQFKQALDHMETLGDYRSMARTDLNIGAVYWQKGDTLEARRHYFTALQQAATAQDSTAILMSCMNLAEWHMASKDWYRAQYYYDRGLVIAQKFGNIEELAKITYAKGLALLEEGRLRMAYELLQQALDIGNGAATGDAQKEAAFLIKLHALIGDESPRLRSGSRVEELLSR